MTSLVHYEKTLKILIRCEDGILHKNEMSFLMKILPLFFQIWLQNAATQLHLLSSTSWPQARLI